MDARLCRPPPLPTIASDDPFEFIAPAAAQIPDDNIEVEDNFIDVMNVPEDLEELQIDEEEQRDFTHNLVGCTVRAFYGDEGGWFQGKIMWYNTKMDKLRVYYEEDGSDDYITVEEIDGVDIILDV